MNDALLPCPWCGSSPFVVDSERLMFSISCSNRECIASITRVYRDKKATIAAWNRRVPSAERTPQVQQGRYVVVDEDYWGYFNVERKGRAISIFDGPDAERDKGYIIVPLPDKVFVCRWQEGEGDGTN